MGGGAGGSNIIEVEKPIYVEDKEKIKEYEIKLQKEKEEAMQKALAERDNIEKMANMAEEEKKNIQANIEEEAKKAKKAKEKQQKMIKKLKVMEEQLVKGT